MDKEQNADIKKALANSKELTYAGEVVEVPIKGWVDNKGVVHFDDEADKSVWIPKTSLKNN